MPAGSEIRISRLHFSWPHSGFGLNIGDLQIASGKKTAFVGPSGSGKTTLLNLIAGIVVPQRGEIMVGEQKLHEMGDAARRRFRIRNVGLVFQQFELMTYLRATENVLLPYFLNASLKLDAAARRRAKELLRATGLEYCEDRFPGRMSQGEQQRLALCRAMVTEPSLILADEPTGNLDNSNKSRVMDLLVDQVHQRGLTLVVVTHDTSLLDRFDQVIDFGDFAKSLANDESAAVGANRETRP